MAARTVDVGGELGLALGLVRVVAELAIGSPVDTCTGDIAAPDLGSGLWGRTRAIALSAKDVAARAIELHAASALRDGVCVARPALLALRGTVVQRWTVAGDAGDGLCAADVRSVTRGLCKRGPLRVVLLMARLTRARVQPAVRRHLSAYAIQQQ